MDKTVLILIDALGYDIAERFRFHPSGLDSRVRLRTVLGFSQAALTSIFTTLHPDEHGLWMMYSFAVDRSPFAFLDAVPRFMSMDLQWLRRIVDWKLRRVDRISSYFSLYRVPRDVIRHLDLPARRDILSPGGAGDAETVIDYLSNRGVRLFIRDYRTPEEVAFADLERAVRSDAADIYILYTAALDADLHRFGCGDRRIGDRLDRYRDRIERLQALLPGARFVVMGDHGMCDVERQVDLISRVESLGLAVPDDYVPFYDSTMARFRVSSKRADEELRRLLADCRPGRLLDDAELDRLRIRFGDGRFGDLIYLVDPGALILPSFMSAEPVLGMHGYHPDAPCMSSVLMTNDTLHGSELSIRDAAAFLAPGFGKVEGRGSV